MTLSMFRRSHNILEGRYCARSFHTHSKRSPKAEFLFSPTEGDFVSPGSNAWAVSGAHTYDGKPILANDPHLAPSIPSIFYMVHLKTPGMDVSGVTIPGLPGVIIGHNRDIAWGLTNIGADYQDVYEEQIDLRSGRTCTTENPNRPA